jgi:hypothetical protein
MKKPVVIFGTGEIAELAYYYMTNDSDLEIVAFTADGEFIKADQFLNKPLVAFEEIEKHYPSAEYDMHVALSYSKLNLIREQNIMQPKQRGTNW